MDFAVFLAAALGSAFGFASALALAFASAFAAGVAGLNGQFSREQDPVRLKHTWFPVRPEGLGVLGRVGVSGVFLE